MTAAVTTIVLRFAAITNSPKALVNRFDCRALYFTKADLKIVASDLGLATNGTRSALCYRIANHLTA